MYVEFCPIKSGTELATSNKSGSSTALSKILQKHLESISTISPVPITIPLSNPILLFSPLKKPICKGSPGKWLVQQHLHPTINYQLKILENYMVD